MQTDQRRRSSIAERLLDARGQFLGYLRKRIDDPELAEDILQDSLLRAMRAAPDLRGDERVIPWFYRVLQYSIVAVAFESDPQKYLAPNDKPSMYPRRASAAPRDVFGKRPDGSEPSILTASPFAAPFRGGKIGYADIRVDSASRVQATRVPAR
jgi:hypothetical protein